MGRAWKCEVCGYIHRGDAPPDTCPVCGVGKELFSAFEVAPLAAVPAPPAAEAWRCTVCDHLHRGGSPPESCPICAAERSFFEPASESPARNLEPDVERVIILGAGVAGLTAAEVARSLAPDVVLTLVAREPALPYFRLNLTRLLAGEVSEESLQQHPPAWYEEQRIELLEDEVLSIDRVRQEVRLRHTGVLPYDRLVLASGAHAFVPPIVGVTREGVHSLRTLADSRAILERAQPGARCVCLGGGLLGLETAGALMRRGLAVTVLEGFESLLPRQLARPAGERLQRHLESLGIGVRCGAKLEEILGDEVVCGVRLSTGEELPAELVLLAAGIRPNSYLARQGGLEVKRGVVVDDRMFTSDPAILAAGDVAEHRGVIHGLWPTAYAQGLVAGTNAVGGSLEFQGLAPSSRLKVLEVDLFSIGQFQPEDASYRVVESEAVDRYVRLVCRDGQLVGANLYGDTTLAGAVKDAIESGAQLATSREIRARLPEAAQCSEGRG